VKAMATLCSNNAHAVWWNDGHALRTRLLVALSLMLPSAEQLLLATTTEWFASDAVAPSARERLHQKVR